MSALNIDSSLQLFADRSLVSSLSGTVEYRLYRPVPRELIECFEDAEPCSYRYMTVFQDGAKYRMYYGLPKVTYEEGKKQKFPERICYAESMDGVNWVKPKLGLFDFEGSTENNIVWMEQGEGRLGVSGFSAFRDDSPNCDPTHRYKAIAEAGPVAKEAFGRNGLLALSSPDGLKWSLLGPELIMTGGPGRGGFDSQNVAFWSQTEGRYRLYRREVFNEGPHNVFRDILTATSTDFLTWTEPQRLSYAGGNTDQLYTNNVIPYFRAPHLFLGFPARYVERYWSDAVAGLPQTEHRKEVIRNGGAEPTVLAPTEAGGQRIGTATTDTLFMAGRDGVNFALWDEAFIRPGLRPDGNWFYADNFQNWGIVTTRSAVGGAPDELSFYVTEGSRRGNRSNSCRRYTLRVDGFVSLTGKRAGGEAVTVPFTFAGRELSLNFAASAAGSIQVEIQDESGAPIPDFRLEDCVEVLGDSLDYRVQWQGDLSTLSGKVVKLRFRIVDADLYAFRFL